MLGWIGDQNDQVADDSKVLEPPETPAPIFALRAFQSALFGTPGADEDNNNNSPLKSKEQHKKLQPREDNAQDPPVDNKRDALKATKADVDLAVTAMASPTKSILLTPGTASNRRKTVSFGESVVDNERKRAEASTKLSKTPMDPAGPITSQWITSSLDGKPKPRSKLTQTLMDSREKSPKGSEETSQKSDETRPSDTISRPVASSFPQDDNEETINLNEPRSQSGKYWKAEFDSYRTKTALEIKRLIQYRSAAKTYARKKDEEASRLAAKLNEEEIKVAEMERHVTQLASTMIAENTRADKEQLVRDLTKQTALALQYKHKVNLLRKVLEQHGVVGAEVDTIAEKSEVELPSKEMSQALRKTQQALAQANSRIEEMEQQQSDFTKLKDLACSSEQKASEIEKENATLKQTLARVKQEMSKYEGRRKEKEAKLKQREAKLEARIQEYRERIKTASQQHREQEEDLKESFNEERRHMQEQIAILKSKLRAVEIAPETGTRQRSPNRRQGYTGIQVYDFGQTSPQRENLDDTEDTDQPPSPSPRAKDRRAHRTSNALGDLDLKRALKAMGLEGSDEKLAYLTESPQKALKSRYQDDQFVAPPSSPPEYPSIETGTWTGATTRRNLAQRHSHLPNHATSSLPSRKPNLEDSHQIRIDRLRSRRSPTKYSLDALSTLPDSYFLDRARRQSLTAANRESLPIDRKVAAQARLKRKDESRKSKEEGKENIRTFKN